MRAAWKKTPVILQTGSSDCGAACLAMVLAAHGREIPLAQIKRRMRIARSTGVDAWKLLKCATRCGLAGEGVAGSARAIRGVPLPAILHWRKNHFVVLVRWNKNGTAEIVDPAKGRETLGPRKFAAGYSGTALRFKKASPQKPKRLVIAKIGNCQN